MYSTCTGNDHEHTLYKQLALQCAWLLNILLLQALETTLQMMHKNWVQTVTVYLGRVSVECRSSNDQYIDWCIGRFIDRGTLKDAWSDFSNIFSRFIPLLPDGIHVVNFLDNAITEWFINNLLGLWWNHSFVQGNESNPALVRSVSLCSIQE